MSLNRFYRPFFESTRSVDNLFNHEFNRIFNNFGLAHPNRFAVFNQGPSVNLYDTKAETKLQVELPGYKKEDVKISIKDKYLTISGESKAEKDVDQDNLKIAERSFGKFSRSFQLDSNNDAEAIQAKYENGILEVTIPKKEPIEPESQEKLIEIS
ncbi:heat shock protein Hsp20 [Conidiobolus coronatus NRRL 28638]|uniref:Heat shock protein Hsp20 n=1 Tax=Conidiobolus coronatus (strain ATCC 28846 / CBS 209.66 / NRRL 28638) TaxID=796925 RepID=A0A137PGB0_CONC2|nr:heat shock protein Hsp20 [Conidiobolus coronatus NRRL 28638]|eukprot:KXN74039.1 heat shock protein Hsp20 [Conidiobolus coronatus NRRL 28638]